MNLFNKRPLLLSLFIFAISTVTCTFLSSYIRKYLSLISFIVLSLLLILCLFFNFFKNKRLKLVFSLTLCAVFAFLAFYSSYSFFDKKVVFAESLGDETGVTAEIRECTFSSSYSNVYTASIKNINGKNVNFNVSISTSEVSLNIGDVVVADMSFSPFSVTEYGFDMRASNISKGILTSASLINIKSIQSNNNFSLFLFFNKLRESISNRVEQNGFEKSSAMINALLLGDTDGIDTKTKSNFSYLGISHILSISGTHFTILTCVFLLVLQIKCHMNLK